MNINKITQIKKATQIKQNLHLIYVIITSNNVLFTVTDLTGKTLLTYSSGAAQYKSHQKTNPTAVTMTGYHLGKKAILKQITNVTVIFKGAKKGRKDVLTGIYNSGVSIKKIMDLTPIPHNGCRRQKQRRV
jgi:small subunit ribosomal protein S11